MRTSITATIASGQSLSGAVDLRAVAPALRAGPHSYWQPCAILMPAAWTAAELSFQASADGTTYGNVVDLGGTEAEVQAAVDRYIPIDPTWFIGATHLKVRSGTSGAAVAQGAARTITIIVSDAEPLAAPLARDASGQVATTATIASSAATIADGADVTQGALADAAVTNPASSASVVAALKGLLTLLGLGQEAMTASIPVTVASDQSEVAVQAGTNLDTSALALEAGGNLAALVTALQIIDDWDESDRAKVNPIAGQAGIAGGTGVDGATVPRVTLATDIGLPAGVAAIGSVTDGGSAIAVDRVYVQSNDGTTPVEITAAPTAGQKRKLLEWEISVDTACAATISEETSGTIYMTYYLPANGTSPRTPRHDYIKADVADKKLLVTTSVASKVAVRAASISEA